MQAMTTPNAADDHSNHEPGVGHGRHGMAAMALAALGVVYGDIGTSPLYALKECVKHQGKGQSLDETFVLGVLSMMFWALMLSVNLKYLLVVMRATNHGEGGIFSLLSLVPRSLSERPSREKVWLSMLAILGAGLLLGDGIITPSISVLSAIEGLEAVPGLGIEVGSTQVISIAMVIIVALFFVQQFGTGRIGVAFGPVMVAWFLAIGGLGLWAILRQPDVLRSINPLHAVRLVEAAPWHAFTLLGTVVLVTTGAEALYADVGHFGLRPIRNAWYTLVYPSLLLNYMGQGAFTLACIQDGSLHAGNSGDFNPFFQLVPDGLRFPVLLLATAAAVIASQAMISGVFSIARQAARMGYLPRLEIIHTSRMAEGQIYIPNINLLMLVGCSITVLWFKTSSNLSHAYGLAVTATFAITTILLAFVARRLWRWRRWQVAAMTAVFLAVDGAYLGSNLLKLPLGGWFALAIGVGAAVVMSTWMQGSYLIGRKVAESASSIHEFLASLWSEAVPRVPGTAVFLTTSSATPFSLTAFVEHSHVLHQQVILVSVHSAHVPVVPPRRQVKLEWMPDGFWKLQAQCGFMETPDIPRFLERAKEMGLDWDPETTTYFARRMVVLPTGDAPMARWRKRLFAHLSAQAVDSIRFFNLPPDRVVEFGVQMEL
ncbi:MAG: potassium transporter Kup [Planctomycetes bacterium]|nr:potassium transporter Kup [Planctomycetota bacterium]